MSQLQMPGMQMLAEGIGPQLYGIERSYGPDSAEDYYARILAKVCEPIVRHLSDGGLLVNYRQLPEAVWTAILPHFGVACSEDERARWRTHSALVSAALKRGQFSISPF